MTLLRPITTLLILLLISLLPVQETAAQVVDDFTFTHLGIAAGLNSLRIYDIRQTADEAIWWTDKDGVERYNGVQLKSYLVGNAEIFSHSGGRIFKFARQVPSTKDKKATAHPLIVFDNKGGIFAYDESTDAFVLHADVAAMTGDEVLLNDVLLADSGAWLAMREGVWFLRDGGKGLDRQLMPVIKDDYANIVLPSKNGFLLCMRDGVFSYRLPHGNVPKTNMKLHQLMSEAMESGYYDVANEAVWLGSYQNGLHILRHEGHQYQIEHCTLPGNATQNPVRCICPYDDDQMLVGIDGMGIYKVSRRHSPTDSHTGSLLFNANEGHEGVLHGNGIYAMICDSWGNIVIGSYSGGIDIARPVGSTPAIYGHQQGNIQSLLNDHVNSVAQFPDGIMAMGTDNGVSLLNPKTHQWQHLCRGAVVLSLCLTPQGTMLAATYGKGVYEITEQGSVRQCYTAGDGVLKDAHVYKLFYDHCGHLWMGCLDNDLVEHSAAQTHYYHINNVQDILQLPDQRIAVGTAAGLWLIDAQTGDVSKLDYAPRGADDVNYYVNTLYMAANGRLWIGTDGGGIYIYDFRSQQCHQLTTANGLPSNIVNSLCKDVKGRVLAATERGLAFAENEQSARFVNVNYCYGIEREYSTRAAARLQNNFMLYGTTSGALLINPENIQKINYSARMKLTGVRCLNDSSAQFRQRIHQMLQNEQLNLPYGQRTFELHFEAINLRNQFDIYYQYQMDGGPWSRPDAQQYIRFTNLESGRHELRLRCISRTCGEVLDEMVLKVAIGQPWWKSWWMWMVYCCLIALLFYGAWRVYELHTKYMRLVVSNPNLSAAPVVAADKEEEEQEAAAPTQEDNEEGRNFIDKATRLVVDHVADSGFTIDHLCREMAMSRTLFYVKLKSYTGKSPQDFMRIIRLERAAALLRNGQPVTDAAILSGFDNPKYFSTVFKKYFGVSPSKYQ